MTYVQDKEGTREADLDAVGAVLGGLALLVFAAVGESLFNRYNSALVLALALLAWLVTIGVLYIGLILLKPDKAQD